MTALILKITDQQGQTEYITAEAKVTANLQDARNAQRRARTLATALDTNTVTPVLICDTLDPGHDYANLDDSTIIPYPMPRRAPGTHNRAT